MSVDHNTGDALWSSRLKSTRISALFIFRRGETGEATKSGKSRIEMASKMVHETQRIDCYERQSKQENCEKREKKGENRLEDETERKQSRRSSKVKARRTVG